MTNAMRTIRSFAAILLPIALVFAAMVMLGEAPAYANGVVITPTFDPSVSSPVQNDINTAISTIEGLYSNTVNIPITFVYAPLSGNALLQTQVNAYYGDTYNNYVNLLKADFAANPGNTVLGTAIAHLGTGNTGGTNTLNGGMAIDGAQQAMLAGANGFEGATITINSLAAFAISGPADSTHYDLIGGLEHEIDEVMGGGGVGSTLNTVGSSLCAPPTSDPICTQEGSTDLYRYSAAGVGSFSTSSTANAYFSIDGGTTSIVAFNQGGSPFCPGGDFGDFSPPGTGAGQLIQNACNNFGQDEAYTTASPEFTMMEAIGWDPASGGTTTPPVPEPSSLSLLSMGLLGAAACKWRNITGRRYAAS